MFDIVSVTLENFRSYRGKHTFRFPTRPGLYNLTGKNLENPGLGPNGCGKSSILEAIYWCLYGRTTRGLKAGDVVSWGAKSCSVTVSLVVGKDHFQVERKQNPNSLAILGEQAFAVDQQTLQKNLRLSPEAFTYSVLLPQFGESFFDLAPAAKLTLFSQILELEHWLEKSREADALAHDIDLSMAKERNSIAKRQGQVETIQADIVDLKRKEKEFSKEQADILQRLNSELSHCKKVNQDDLASIKQLKNALILFEQKAAALIKEGEEYRQRQDKAGAKVHDLQTKAAVLESNLKGLREKRVSLTGLGASCPTCFQPVDKLHLKAELSLVNTQIKGSENGLLLFTNGIGYAKKDLYELSEEARKVERDLTTIGRNRSDHERELAKITAALEASKTAQLTLRNTIATETARSNPYTAQIKEKNRLLAELMGKIARQGLVVEQLISEHSAVSYWINGFKRVRLFIVEETLRQLEIEVNNSLTSLGLLDWRVEFDVERENKSGSVTKGFTVLVHAPGHKGPVKWESFSGGEVQRLRLAGDLGLANLMMDAAGLSSQVEFHDEPSEHLSDEGLLDLAETLETRATATGKRIWLVDHRLLDYGGFAGVYTAVRDEEGSRIE